MGKLITIAGNIGSGKTTLARLLCEQGGYTPYWEKPEERPFQQEFSADMRKWALANQMDFFIYRCNQEMQIRTADQIALMDGGLDQDFHVFTKNLKNKGYLGSDEFRMCEDFYFFARSFLPPPDLIIRLLIDTPTLLQRRSKRVRQTVDQSFDPQEFEDLDHLLDTWLMGEASSPVLTFPFKQDLTSSVGAIKELLTQIEAAMHTSGDKSDKIIT